MQPFVLRGFLLCASVVATQPIIAQDWAARGPGPIRNGQVEGIADREAVGAINAVAPDPTNTAIVYVGAVNGGIWKTSNATSANPTWQRLSDSRESLSIGALEFDPTDATSQTLVAGIGLYSSFGYGGQRVGLLRTTDGGGTWTLINGGGTLTGVNISGVAPRGNTIVISSNYATSGANQGIWRTTNGGATWTRLSGTAGLPIGRSFDLVGDPTNPAVLYTHFGTGGVYRSNDVGANWTKVSDASIDTQLSAAGNVEFAVGTHNEVYVAIVTQTTGKLSGLYRSGDGGATWVAMDLPANAQGGIHPGNRPQGNLHLSIAADPINANIVYIGGDSQNSPFPNAFGAMNYTGRLFRGDASQPSGSQFVHLTHSRTVGPAGGGTISSSAPHSDSRDMHVDANGELIEVDDGGIYRRTGPQTNNGDWFSMNGDIQTTEFHSVAYDANSHAVIGGAQDNDTPEQLTLSTLKWRNVSSGDGGQVEVDDSSTPGVSLRYSSSQFLGFFQRETYDAGNNFMSRVFPSLAVSSGAPLTAQFYTPIKLNTFDPRRLIIGGANSVYESLDQGNTIAEIGVGIRANGTVHPIAYGAADNPDILYVGSSGRVYVRTSASPAALVQSAAYPGVGLVNGIALNPADSRSAYVIDPSNVFWTADAGGTWTNISGNLSSFIPGTFRSIAYATYPSGDAVIVGGDAGIFIALGPAFNTWLRLGSNLPTVPTLQVEYDRKDDVVLAGTAGRGAWTFNLTDGWTDDGTVVRLTSATDLVGIGTTNPGNKLTVGDRAAPDANTNVEINATTAAGIVFSGGGPGGNISFNLPSNSLRFAISPDGFNPPTEGMRLTSTGLGIGTTSTGTNRLAVTGPSLFQGNISVLGHVGILAPPSATSRLAIGGDAEISGNLGLGTAPGGSRLSVAGNADVTGNVGIGAASSVANRLAVTGNTLLTGNTQVTGNVGMGTAPSTTSRLAVTGNMLLTGNAQVTGNAQITGNAQVTGNVGMGTAPSAANRLAVLGDVEIRANSPTLNLLATGEVPARLRFADADAVASENFDIFFNASDQGLHFRSDDKEMMSLSNDGIIFFTPKNLQTTHPTITGSQFAIGWNSTGGRGEIDFYQHGGGGWRSGYDFYTQRDGQGRRLVARIEDTGNLKLLGSVGSLSDARAKVNVHTIANPLRKVMELRGVSFNWKDGEAPGDATHIGLVAQEVLKVVPEVVGGGVGKDGTEELYSVQYANLVPLLVEALKEQQRSIERLTKRVSELEKRDK